MMRWLSLVSLVACVSCASQTTLQENKELRARLEALQQQMGLLQGNAPEEQSFTPIQGFTVGLAATERNFDDEAFVRLLRESLRAASGNEDFRVRLESNERQVGKLQGLLLQQFLAEEEVPITISNLAFKLEDGGHDFKIGGRIVPRADREVRGATGGGLLHVTYAEPIPARMSRQSADEYTVTYEERGAGSGAVRIRVPDAELLNQPATARSARQGDISFNWSLRVDKLNVYRVENFSGDVGLFMRLMRYPTVRTAISQYQTLRDAVLLFGYGTFKTGLVSQIRTPAYVDNVEVVPVSFSTFEQLRGDMPLDELESLISREGKWQSCQFIDFSSDTKVWERPRPVTFPFVARQTSSQKGLVFFTKFDAEGSQLLGDFEKAR